MKPHAAHPAILASILASTFVITLLAAIAVAHANGSGQDFVRVEQGRYLTIVGDCEACHTAPAGKPFAGGRTIETPFGTLVSPNITPDRMTGIGDWTEADFLRAMHRGINRMGQHLYPAFPYVYFVHVTDADIRAIKAYLDTLQPVFNKVAVDQLPFPLDQRAGLAAWNLVNFKPGPFKPNPKKSALWNRGAYLVTGLGHCGLCHTPKTITGGDDDGQFLQGATVEGWYAPDITGDERTGLGSWSLRQIAAYLRNGHNAIAAASGPMREEVEESSAKMTGTDLLAIATYLKDLPGRHRAATPIPANTRQMQAGRAIYADECSACHGESGAGVPRLFPALAEAAAVQQRSALDIIRVVLQGAQSSETPHAVTGPAMPSFGWKLSNAEIAATATYIRNSWRNAATAVSAGEVGRVRSALRKPPS